MLANSGLKITFELLHNESVTEDDRLLLSQSALGPLSSIRFHSVQAPVLDHLPTTGQFGSIVWLRFLLPQLLSDRDRTIYLDSDTLVMDNLSDLWCAPLDGRPLAAVPNVVEPALRPHVESLGVRYPGGFFNSGVLVLDLNLMRSERATDRLLAIATSGALELIWPDQDALNYVFRERWLALDPRWNVQNSFWAWRQWALEIFDNDILEAAINAPGIRHFEGPGLAKPWHYLCPYPGYREYRRILAMTAWGGTELVDRGVVNRVLKLLPTRWRPDAYERLNRIRSRVNRSGSRQSVVTVEHP